MKNYCTTSRELLKSLPKRTEDILVQRFGLFGGKKYTLENIGKKYNITRERVRQVEKDGIKQTTKKTKDFSIEFDYLKQKMNSFGGLKREDLFINSVAKEEKGNEERNCIMFLLHLCEDFLRFPGNKDVFSFWIKGNKTATKAKELMIQITEVLAKKQKLLKLPEIKKLINNESITDEFLVSVIEVSKKITESDNGLYGLSKWPEINPRGIKDKAYIAFKKINKPLHFREVASLLGKDTNAQTTHNELIKDSRFVLIGRGVYALAEWGYTPGEVKEVIRNILIEKGALNKNDIIVHVSEKRIVKKNTIIQNLSNKNYFIRTPDGKYTIA